MHQRFLPSSLLGPIGRKYVAHFVYAEASVLEKRCFYFELTDGLSLFGYVRIQLDPVRQVLVLQQPQHLEVALGDDLGLCDRF